MILCHIPFIFYIGKEHILQSIDEQTNFSLSQMVDRIKHRFKGDPRHFLVEKQFKEIEIEPKCEIVDHGTVAGTAG